MQTSSLSDAAAVAVPVLHNLPKTTKYDGVTQNQRIGVCLKIILQLKLEIKFEFNCRFFVVNSKQ